MPSFLASFYKFQSAPPVKGAIVVGIGDVAVAEVSIRAPREGGDGVGLGGVLGEGVSIRAPREGGDSV